MSNLKKTAENDDAATIRYLSFPKMTICQKIADCDLPAEGEGSVQLTFSLG